MVREYKPVCVIRGYAAVFEITYCCDACLFFSFSFLRNYAIVVWQAKLYAAARPRIYLD